MTTIETVFIQHLLSVVLFLDMLNLLPDPRSQLDDLPV